MLQEQGCQFDVIRYLEEGIRAEDAPAIAAHVNSVRRKDIPEGVGGDTNTIEGRAALILAQPRCMERPVLINTGVAAIGRPPENVLKLLD